MTESIQALSSLVTIVFMVLSIVLTVRAWPILKIIIDRAKLVKEIEQGRERERTLQLTNDNLTDAVGAARMAAEAWQAELAITNRKLDNLTRTVEDLGHQLALSIGYNVVLVDYIERDDPSERRPEPPKEIRAAIARAKTEHAKLES